MEIGTFKLQLLETLLTNKDKLQNRAFLKLRADIGTAKRFFKLAKKLKPTL